MPFNAMNLFIGNKEKVSDPIIFVTRKKKLGYNFMYLL
jgi:hypothetical protein